MKRCRYSRRNAATAAAAAAAQLHMHGGKRVDAVCGVPYARDRDSIAATRSPDPCTRTRQSKVPRSRPFYELLDNIWLRASQRADRGSGGGGVGGSGGGGRIETLPGADQVVPEL